MVEPMLTGSSSSYARKYALNGLFCIDDTKDADTLDNSKEPKKEVVELSTEIMSQLTKYVGLVRLKRLKN